MRYILFALPLLCLACAPQSTLLSSGVKPNEGKSFLTPEGGGGWRAGPETIDPLQNDPRYQKQFAEAEAKTEKILMRRGVEPQIGYCHIYWQTLKKVLRRDYGIDWKSPAELNPWTSYD